MNEYDVKIGSVVLSMQGRDKGMYFVVTAIDKGFVFLVDGGMRKFCAPKKKNVKHVSFSGTVLQNIASKLTTGAKVFDSEVKSALRPFNQQIKENQ